MWAVRAGVMGLVFLLSTDAAVASDSVTRRVVQLTGSSAFKIRLSAAVSLGKTSDPRAVVALAYAVRRDRSSAVRRVAVAGLTKMAQRGLPRAALKDALTAIDYAAKKDRDRKVRKTAKKAQSQVASLRRQLRKKSGSSKGLYVAIGKPSDPKRRTSTGTHKQIKARVVSTIQRQAPSYKLGSVSGSVDQNGRVFFVGATISEVETSKNRGQTEVKCKVTVRVSPMQDGREHFIAGESASAKGTGRVIGGNGSNAINESKRQCVLAVVEQVTERQVVPFIRKIAKR